MLQKLIIVLAQVKAGKTFKNLFNKVNSFQKLKTENLNILFKKVITQSQIPGTSYVKTGCNIYEFREQ